MYETTFIDNTRVHIVGTADTLNKAIDAAAAYAKSMSYSARIIDTVFDDDGGASVAIAVSNSRVEMFCIDRIN